MCPDAAVLGTPFYLMQFLPGRIYVDPNCSTLAPPLRRAAYVAMARALAALHSVPPADIGLAGFGRPQHYCARQVARWDTQYRSQLQGPPMAEMAALTDWLRANVPVGDGDASVACITHGDFRLDNLVRVMAVVVLLRSMCVLLHVCVYALGRARHAALCTSAW